MKSTVKVLAFFALFWAMLALAQPQPYPPFKHVIIIVQENRTPDNLFGVATTPEAAQAGLPPLPMSPGVDLQLAGSQYAQKWCLGTCFDPNHEWNAWKTQYNGNTYGNWCKAGGTIDCAASYQATCNGQTTCTSGNCQAGDLQLVPTQSQPNSCEQYTYVSAEYDSQYFLDGTGNPQSPLLPYFSIASQYGFANYFYQTNEGPSQPAHDFLFGGTSAPAGAPTDPLWQYYQYFQATNASPELPTGCEANSSALAYLISPAGIPGGLGPQESPCFNHNTMADLLTSNGLTWAYYTNNPKDIWTAPNGISHICEPDGENPPVCQGQAFTGAGNPGNVPNVVHPDWNFFLDDTVGGTNLPGNHGEGLCHLPSVSWVIPNGYWSDHPGASGGNYTSTTTELGPDWVAAIINSVGQAKCTEVAGQNVSPWTDTVIFVVWDDWGGFYDHVGALEVNASNCWPNCTPSWGAGYTYGFRVPFLVVSAWTSQYVSGACTIGGTCVGNGGNGSMDAPPYQHDFGSILAFIENIFDLPVGGINPINGESFTADGYYPEQYATPPALPLVDFFNLWPTNQTGQSFMPISVAGPYPTSYFSGYNGAVADPDNDAIDND